MIGTVVDGKYDVIRLLGQGGMGAVFEVRHLDTNRHLALKVIRAADASKQRALVLRLQREAKAAGSIDSPHIGQVIDAGTDPTTDSPYLVMELLQGEDVQQVLDRVGSLRPDAALRIVAQACLGLAKAHEARVVHRDVKPANLFLARQRDGELVVKVLDFGIAKLKQEDLGAMESGSLTRTGSVLGSPLYMSPEQARGKKTIDHRADLWSLGVVAYQLLTGRTPYQEIEALGELILAICSELPPCVQDFAPWVDPALAESVHKALSLDAMERYQTAEEMFAALTQHLPRAPDGTPDLGLREESLVSPDEVAKSVTAPRHIAEMGRRPAITTRPRAQHVVTPSGPFDASSSSNGRSGDRVSAADIEAGPTLMLAPAEVAAATAHTGGDARAGTAAGVSRSSPAEPRGSRVPLVAGVIVAAAVVGVGAAFLGRGVLAPVAPAASAAVAPTAPPPPETPAPAATPQVVAPAPPAASSVVEAPAASASAAPSTSARAAPGVRPGAPTGPAPPRTASAAAPPPKAAPAGTTGFGDRK